jgi:undecaprenyl-diphosphatase
MRRVVASLGAYGLAGAAATVGLTWLFFAIADEIPERSALVRIDVAVSHWLETHGTEGGETFFYWVTQIGGPVLTALVVAGVAWLAWRRRRRDALALAIVSTGGILLSNGLKLLFQRVRPETATEFITRHSWSFPSGHALNSMVSYGFLAVLVLERTRGRRQRMAVLAAAAILIGAIGFSRLYLGVHYLSDVLAGWVAGGAWLIASIFAYRYAKRRLAASR